MNTYFIVFLLMAACGLASALGPPRALGGSNMRQAVKDAERRLGQVSSRDDARRAARKNLLLLVWLVATVALLACLLDGLL
ncbi:MAG: hypothetical protein PW791_13340 [Neorhizobium sp.]|nr:hypothetical protein [Neorhizobium sp.]